MSFGICPSIGVGLSGQGGLSPAWLTSKLAADNGSNLVGLLIGADIAADVSGWAASVGGFTLTNATAGRFTAPVVAAMGGRRCLFNDVATGDIELTATGIPAYKSVLASVWIPALPWTVAYSTVLNGGVSVSSIIAAGAGTSTWYPQTTLYRDGLATLNAATGPGVYQSDGTVAGTVAHVGGHTTLTRNWLGAIGVIALFAEPPSEALRLTNSATLHRYHRIP
jgi:hypothetical protein